MTWVPLHVHSQYSILDALPSVNDLAKRAAKLEMPALALTDHGNLYGAVDFAGACAKHGVRPITGCEFYVAPRSRLEKSRMPGKRVAHHLILLAKDATGYRNLCELSSRAFLEGFYYFPRIDKELLAEHAEGLVCLSACLSGEVAQAILDGGDGLEEVEWYRNLFGDDYYLELQRHEMTTEMMEADGFLEESWLQQQYDSFIEKQRKVNERLVEIGVPIVATNDSHYMDREDWKAHEVLLNIQSGEPCEIWERDSLGNPKVRVPNPKRRTYSSHEVYFKTPAQMKELFADLPEAISNTVEVAEKCQFQFDFETKHYPVYIGENKDLKERSREAVPKRYTESVLAAVKKRFPDRDPSEMVRERIDYELSVILPKGLGDYLLIVADFINWAKEHNIPVGPGRGSGAGSIILFLLGVTDIEPLRFNLFFERFINPERPSYPDIDVDICMERRGEVIQYVVEKYGKDCVAQIITFGTLKARMAIRDVGRVLNVPLPKVDGIAKLVPDELGITLGRALDTDPDLYRLYTEDEEAKRLLEYAQKLEGAVRNSGIHAAGLIVSGEPLTHNVPICTAKDSELAATQYAMKPVEKVGMLKIDMLGLKTLTSIRYALASVEKRTGEVIDPLTLSLDDEATFALLQEGKTAGVFQMESGGMQALSKDFRPEKFEDLMVVIALYRPGPMELIPSFVARKAGQEPIEYDHPLMEEILEETYGIMVYQEQVMQIAQTLAGYSLGEGDLLRKAMGKKIIEEMERQRVKFVDGAVENGIERETAVNIFEKMEKFASYGFNKPHAASYGFLTYTTAYLKANYPSEWMAALMTCDRHDITKIARWIRECQSMGVAILSPDINEASGIFEPVPSGVRFAMTAIKSVGEGVVEAILEERKKGLYASLHDFIQRIDHRKVGKKVIEALIDAGCFDFTGWTRDQLRYSVEPMFEDASRAKRDEAVGALSLFSLIEEEKPAFSDPPQVEATPQTQLLMREKELLGFFLSGHPMDLHRETLERLSCIPLREVEKLSESAVLRTAFIVETLKTRISQRSQRKFAILTVSDGLESFELPVWSDVYEERGHLLAENQLYYAVVQVEWREGRQRLSARWLDILATANDKTAAACDAAYDRAKQSLGRRAYRKAEPVVEAPPAARLHITLEEPKLSHILDLKKIFRSASGKSPVTLEFKNVGRVSIDSSWGVDLSDALIKKIRQVPSVIQVDRKAPQG